MAVAGHFGSVSSWKALFVSCHILSVMKTGESYVTEGRFFKGLCMSKFVQWPNTFN